MRTRSNLAMVVVLALSMTGCLKTRAQLREDAEDGSRPAAPIQEVKPQGQYVVDELKSEITRLEGRVEDLERTQKDLATQATSAAKDKEDYKKIDARLVVVEQSQTETQDVIKKLQEVPVVKDPEETFQKAKAKYAEEDYEAAADLFGTYLKGDKIKYTQDATFLRGECYYKLKQYKKAIIEYSKFPEKYERSTKMPEALYKIGMSFDALGMKDDAKGFYQELVEKYPKSSEAKKVRKKVK